MPHDWFTTWRRITESLRAGSHPRPPVPQGRVTPLAPFDPATRTRAPTPPVLAPGDMALVRHHWHLHAQHNPGMTWRQFHKILTKRERFYAEERAERESKLAALTRPNP